MKKLLLITMLSFSISSYGFFSKCKETKAGQRLIHYIQELKVKCERGEVEQSSCSMYASIRIQSYIGIATTEEIHEARILSLDLPKMTGEKL